MKPNYFRHQFSDVSVQMGEIETGDNCIVLLTSQCHLLATSGSAVPVKQQLCFNFLGKIWLPLLSLLLFKTDWVQTMSLLCLTSVKEKKMTLFMTRDIVKVRVHQTPWLVNTHCTYVDTCSSLLWFSSTPLFLKYLPNAWHHRFQC